MVIFDKFEVDLHKSGWFSYIIELSFLTLRNEYSIEGPTFRAADVIQHLMHDPLQKLLTWCCWFLACRIGVHPFYSSAYDVYVLFFEDFHL